MYGFILALSICFVALFSFDVRAQNGPTGHQVLSWGPESQRSFLSISMAMAGTIATQARPDIAKCIGEWYPADEKIREKRHVEMLEIMKENVEFHPSAVVLAVIQKECGKFSDG